MINMRDFILDTLECELSRYYTAVHRDNGPGSGVIYAYIKTDSDGYHKLQDEELYTCHFELSYTMTPDRVVFDLFDRKTQAHEQFIYWYGGCYFLKTVISAIKAKSNNIYKE